MATVVRCDKERCKFNDEGECVAQVIELDEEGTCLDFEKFIG